MEFNIKKISQNIPGINKKETKNISIEVNYSSEDSINRALSRLDSIIKKGGGIEAVAKKLEILHEAERPGEYIKYFEENTGKIYFGQKWVEDFTDVLKKHKHSFLKVHKNKPYTGYCKVLLQKNGIPQILAELISGNNINDDYYKPENLLEQAVLYRNRGEFYDAIDFCDLALKQGDETSRLYNLKGLIYEDMELVNKAVEIYNKAIEKDSSNHTAYAHLAALIQKADKDKAIEYIENAINLSPGTALYYKYKGEIMQKMFQDVPEAIKCFERAGEMAENDSEILFSLGEMYMAQNDTENAIKYLRRGVRADETNHKNFYNLTCLLEDSDIPLAILYINSALKLMPENSAYIFKKACLLKKSGAFDEAEEVYKKVIESDDKNDRAFFDLSVLLRDREPEKSLEYATKAINLNTSESEYYFHKGWLLKSMGQFTDALMQFRRVATMDDTNPAVFYNLALLLEEEQPPVALGYINRAIRLNPGKIEYYDLCGRVLTDKLNNFEEALNCYDRAIAIMPYDIHCNIQKAELLYRLNKNSFALEQYKKVAEIDPGNHLAFYRISILLKDIDPDTALTYINSAINLEPSNSSYSYHKAQLLEKLQQARLAAKLYKTAIRQDIRNTDAYKNLALLIAEDDRVQAIAFFTRAIKMEPEKIEYYYAFGELCERIHETEMALEQYRIILEKDSESDFALSRCAKLRMKSEPDNAIKYIDKALGISPDNAEYHGIKAEIFLIMNDAENAVHELNESIRLSHKDSKDTADYYFKRAEAYYLLGKHAEAKSDYGNVLSINKITAETFEKIEETENNKLKENNPILSGDCSKACVKLAFYLKEEKPEEAWKYASLAGESVSNILEFCLLKGEILENISEPVLAAEQYRKAVKLDEGNEHSLARLGYLFKNSMPELAVSYLDKAIKICGERGEVNNLYSLWRGEALYEYGNAKEAEAQYRSVIEREPENHEAHARIAGILTDSNPKAALRHIDEAILLNGNSALYYLWKAELVSKKFADIKQAVKLMDKAISIEPDNVEYHLKKIKLLENTKQFININLAKRKLKKLLPPEPEEIK